MKQLPNTLQFNVVWVREPADCAECTSCKNRGFGKMFRKWENPVRIGERVIWKHTDEKVCFACYNDLNKKDHEARCHVYFKRGRRKGIPFPIKRREATRPRDCNSQPVDDTQPDTHRGNGTN